MIGPIGAGADAVDARVDLVDGGAPAHRWTPRAAHSRMGAPPLAEVTAHRVGAHWHLVTRGLSQMVPVGVDDPEGEGWGFELSLRVSPADGEPLWAVELLTNLAAYVWGSGHAFADGHHLDLRGPMELGTATDITAAAVVLDPVVGVVDGPWGPVEVLQLVGLCADELELCRSWSTASVLELLGRHDPLLVTDLRRASLLADPALAAEAAGRAALEGSELTELRVGTLALRRGRWGRGAVIELGSGGAAALGPALRRELGGPGGSFAVIGDAASLRFSVGADPGWRLEGGSSLVVDVPAGEVEALAAMFTGRTGWGRRPALPGLRIHVVA